MNAAFTRFEESGEAHNELDFLTGCRVEWYVRMLPMDIKRSAKAAPRIDALKNRVAHILLSIVDRVVTW